jgi:16S rRNA A1518/A1519 N6-dimethyltransferase RsmA/KsgA/DIM1 with predicted DNA glycosylase/AP lyase activity
LIRLASSTLIVLCSLALQAQTPDIHFVPTSNGVTDAMLKLAQVTDKDVVYDLGSGDGAIVLRAAEKFGARGVGIEIDAGLVKESTERARKRGLSDKVRFIQGDLFKADISEATVVTLYLSNSINRRLAPKLMKELKPGSRVVSHRFDMYDWPPDEKVKAGGRDVFLWHIR